MVILFTRIIFNITKFFPSAILFLAPTKPKGKLHCSRFWLLYS
uniref:Uncharacterized protein n=1 Tax=Rhizophora mucronata TaxID=61149 RepID=A0A2P2QXZ2_RHIMU